MRESGLRRGTSSLLIAVVIFIMLSMAYYLYSWKNESEMLQKKHSSLAWTLKTCMAKSRDCERKYKGCGNNKKLFQQSNKELQMSVAKQEKEISDLEKELTIIKTKLSTAFTFYIQMKELLGVSGALSSHEKDLDPTVVKTLKETFSKLKSERKAHKQVNESHLNLMKKMDTLSSTHGQLKKNMTKLQKDNTRVFNNYNKLQKSYQDLSQKLGKITLGYSKQSSLNIKLEKEISSLKKEKNTKEVKVKKEIPENKIRGKDLTGNTSPMKTVADLKDTVAGYFSKLVSDPKVNKKINVTKTQGNKNRGKDLAAIKPTVKRVTVLKNIPNKSMSSSSNIKSTLKNRTILINKNQKDSNIKKLQKNLTIVKKESKITKSNKQGNAAAKVNLGKPLNTITKINPITKHLSSKYLPSKISSTKSNIGKINKHDNKLSSKKTALITKKRGKTNLPKPTKAVGTKKVIKSKSDKNKHDPDDDEPFPTIHPEGSFDEEDKHEPDGILDKIDQNGLSERATVDG